MWKLLARSDIDFGVGGGRVPQYRAPSAGRNRHVYFGHKSLLPLRSLPTERCDRTTARAAVVIPLDTKCVHVVAMEFCQPDAGIGTVSGIVEIDRFSRFHRTEHALGQPVF